MNITAQQQCNSRRGTTVIEVAFVLPVFLFFLLALIEFGHAQMVLNVLRSACRTGVRIGSTEGITTAVVENKVREVISSAINANSVDVIVKDAGVFDTEGPYPETSADFATLPEIDLSETEPKQLFMVHASVAYNDIALVPMAFMDGVVLNAQSFIRHE